MSTATIDPVSVSPATAAAAIDLHPQTIRQMMVRDVFTVLRPDGAGRGKRTYLMFDEVRLYGETRDELAVRDLRRRKHRLSRGGRS